MDIISLDSKSRGETTYFPIITPYPQEQRAERVVPRNIFTSGTLPGNTVIRIGEKNVEISGADRRITVTDEAGDMRVIIGRF